MRAYGRIYCATCKTTGKVYVGQTTKDAVRRMREHVRLARVGSELPFHRALRKYERQDFTLYVVETCRSRRGLNEAEARWIKKLGAFGKGGYNCTTGGEGYEVSEETRRKESLARLGKSTSAAHKAALSVAMKGEKNPFFGRKHKAKTVRQMKAKLSKMFSGESNPFYGKKHSPETLEKMAAANRGKPMHPNTRTGIAKANKGNQYTKGRKITVEHKEQYSKLTADDARLIKRNPEGLTKAEFARRLGVTWWAIHNVLIGRTWKDVSV